MQNILLINIGIGLRLLGIILFSFFVLPKAWKEAWIKDSLSILRKMIFLLLCLYVLFGVVSLFINECLSVSCNNTIVSYLSVINSLSMLTVGTVLSIIYSKHWKE